MIKSASNGSKVYISSNYMFLCNEVRLMIAEGAVGKEDDILGVLAPDYGGCSHRTRF